MVEIYFSGLPLHLPPQPAFSCSAAASYLYLSFTEIYIEASHFRREGTFLHVAVFTCPPPTSSGLLLYSHLVYLSQP